MRIGVVDRRDGDVNLDHPVIGRPQNIRRRGHHHRRRRAVARRSSDESLELARAERGRSKHNRRVQRIGAEQLLRHEKVTDHVRTINTILPDRQARERGFNRVRTLMKRYEI